MEKCSRFLSSAILVFFALLFGFGLLLGVCQQEHLSYPAAFALAIALVGLYALYQKRPRTRSSVWERLGAWKTAALLLVFCFGANLVWILIFRPDLVANVETYWYPAAAFMSAQAARGAAGGINAELLTYPSFLSLILRTFGTGALTVPLMNVCLTTLSGLFLYRLTIDWRGQNSAAFVLLVWSLFPSVLLYNDMVFAEPWYTCLLLGALLLAECAEKRRPRPVPAAAAGVLAGLLLAAAYTESCIGCLPAAAFIIWLLLLRSRGSGAPGRVWLCFALPLLAVWLLLGPVLDLSGAARSAASVTAGREGGSLLVSTRHVLADLHDFVGNDEGGAFYSRGWLGERRYAVLAMLSNIAYYALGILALWGTWRLFRSEERRTDLLLPLFIGGLILSQLGGGTSARYHYAAIPMLILLASFSYTKPVSTAAAPDRSAAAGGN